MSVFIKIIVLVCLISVTSGISAAQEWRGLRPLHSTCEDVKRTLGVTTCEPPNETYDLGDEKVRITFSKSLCHKAWQQFWNVPPGTVLSIERNLMKRIPLAELQIGVSNYEKTFTDFTDQIIYVSKEEGVEVSAINGEVNRIIYTPTPRDDYLLCPNSPKPQPDVTLGVFVPWFDKYGKLAFNEEKKRLDYLAKELPEHGPGTKGYIVIYPDRRTHAREAQKRADRAKTYLVTVHGIEAERIVTVIGGLRISSIITRF